MARLGGHWRAFLVRAAFALLGWAAAFPGSAAADDCRHHRLPRLSEMPFDDGPGGLPESAALPESKKQTQPAKAPCQGPLCRESAPPAPAPVPPAPVVTPPPDAALALETPADPAPAARLAAEAAGDPVSRPTHVFRPPRLSA